MITALRSQTILDLIIQDNLSKILSQAQSWTHHLPRRQSISLWPRQCLWWPMNHSGQACTTLLKHCASTVSHNYHTNPPENKADEAGTTWGLSVWDKSPETTAPVVTDQRASKHHNRSSQQLFKIRNPWHHQTVSSHKVYKYWIPHNMEFPEICSQKRSQKSPITYITPTCPSSQPGTGPVLLLHPHPAFLHSCLPPSRKKQKKSFQNTCLR